MDGNRIACFLALGLLAAAAQAAEVVATGLNNPRGLNFGPDGKLYVAESGLSGDATTTGEVYTSSGAITRIDLRRHTQTQFISGLPSLQVSGETGGEAVGPTDVNFGDGKAFLLYGLGQARNPASYAGFATLYRFDTRGRVWPVADIGNYEFANNPDGTLLDSNPYGLLVLPHQQLIADAGANAIFRNSDRNGLSLLTVLPRALFCLPTGCIDSAHDPVPTTIARGPDGAYYTSQLYPIADPNSTSGHSTPVYRISPDGSETAVYANGFGAVVDIAFDKKGRLFVLEIFAGGFPPLSAGGGLWQINPDGSRCRIAGPEVSEQLSLPGGIAVGNDGALYVTDNATSNGTGVVLKLKPCRNH